MLLLIVKLGPERYAIETNLVAEVNPRVQMRAAHSIKGAARIVQIDVAAELSHKMANFFVAVQEGRSNLTSEHVDTLLKGVDLLRAIAEAADDVASWQAATSGGSG